MRLDPAPALGAPQIELGDDPFALPPARGGRRLKVYDVLLALMVLSAGGAVVANALMMQVPGRHALFAPAGTPGAAASAPGARSTTIPLSVPLPQANTHGRTGGGGDNGALGYLAAKTSVTGMSTPLKPVSAEEAAAGAIAAPRPVSTLRPPLKVGPLAATGPMTVPSDSEAIRPPADVPASSRVVAVQRALSKLGYGPVKASGIPDLQTREAIRHFERDRRLPVDGNVSDTLVRELSVISGLSIP